MDELTPGGVLLAIAGLIGLDGPYEYSGRFFEDFFPAALLALGFAGLLTPLCCCSARSRAATRRPRTSASTRGGWCVCTV